MAPTLAGSGGLCVGLAVGLMLFKLSLWTFVVRPAVATPWSMLYVAATALMVWSYARAMLVQPRGLCPDVKVSPDGQAEDPAPRYCEVCDRAKPAFVHHCSVCQRCVYRMDHHCPWTNNCVGWDNKKFFLLFLFYAALSCLSFAAMAAPLVVGADAQPGVVLKFGWGLAIAIGALLAGYLTFNLWLLRQGRTTLEFLSGSPGELADYSLGYTLRVYFGNDKWTWALPTTPTDLRAGYRAVLTSEETQKLVA
jgi:hypothetical protein